MEISIPVIFTASIRIGSVISQKMKLYRLMRSGLPLGSLRILPIQLMIVLPVLGKLFAEVAVSGIVMRKGIASVIP